MRRAISLLLFAPPMLSACVTRPAPPPPPPSIVVFPPPPGAADSDWSAIAAPADRTRLQLLPGELRRAIAAVPRRFAARVQAEGPLLDPAKAEPKPALPPGPYHCRLLRLGGRAGLVTYAPDFCYVQAGPGAAMGFVKQTGSNLPQGWLYPDTDTRVVFLGALRARPADRAPAYGVEPARDVAGLVERVSPFRWRLTLANARQGAALDLYELVPVTPSVPGAKPTVPDPKSGG